MVHCPFTSRQDDLVFHLEPCITDFKESMRHKKSYGQRISTNIKRARASVSKETLGEFYDNLENTLRGLPSSNIFNYDESNLSDDPGKKRRIYRLEVKYPEKPLDVGFFRPMKGAWRETLTDFKLQNLRLSTVPKDMFPSLLKKSPNKMDTVTARVVKPNETNQIQFETSKLESAIKRNLINSSRSTGIHPAVREQVFKELPPEQVADPTPIVENALTAFLKEQRFGDAVPSQRKKTRLEVQPVCSISTAAYGQESDDDEEGELGIEDRPASVSSICDVGEEEANSEDFEVGQFILGMFHSQRGKKT
ncbi:hypothetical protein JTB14_003594 [Gonioctena quinquepunctata]|nr:hypothetical protein JTB14_003594 [Gonioctena quinquepunctata]